MLSLPKQKPTLGRIAIIFGLIAILVFSIKLDGSYKLDWNFLSKGAKFEIGFSLISFSSSDTVARAFLVGFLNTFIITAIGVVLSTILGIIIAVFRSSGSPLGAAVSKIYLFLVRNVPFLIQLLVWFAISLTLPSPDDSNPMFGGGLIVTSRGIYVPAVDLSPAAAIAAGLSAVLVIVAIVSFFKRATKLSLVSLGLAVAAVLFIWLSDNSMQVSYPENGRFNIKGGSRLPVEIATLSWAITIYYGAFLSEIIRSGIKSVPAGQAEAARSLGLRPAVIWVKVIFPQALRAIIPAATSQYMLLLKTSSLGIAIGFAEAMGVANSVMTVSGRSIEAMFVIVAFYLISNLVIATALNMYNRAVQLKGF